MASPRPQRISDKMIKDLRDFSKDMIRNGSADPFKKDQTSLRAITDKIATSPEWKQTLSDLKTKFKVTR